MEERDWNERGIVGQRVFTCILKHRLYKTTYLTFPHYIHQVFNVFLKNIHLQSIYFSFLVCRDLSQNAIRRLRPRIFTGPSQLRYLYVFFFCHFFVLNKYVLYDKNSLFPTVHMVLTR